MPSFYIYGIYQIFLFNFTIYVGWGLFPIFHDKPKRTDSVFVYDQMMQKNLCWEVCSEILLPYRPKNKMAATQDQKNSKSSKSDHIGLI